jgi:hypothetical protein
VLTLFAALVTVESMMTAIAPLVPHFLMGIAAGAGILGAFMVVTGFVQPTDQLPKPVLRWPMHFMSFQVKSPIAQPCRRSRTQLTCRRTHHAP